MRVGMEVIWACWAITCSASVSTLAKVISGLSSAAFSNTGANILQGPHQSAQKSTKTMPSLVTVSSKVSNVISVVANALLKRSPSFPGKLSPRRAIPPALTRRRLRVFPVGINTAVAQTGHFPHEPWWRQRLWQYRGLDSYPWIVLLHRLFPFPLMRGSPGVTAPNPHRRPGQLRDRWNLPPQSLSRVNVGCLTIPRRRLTRVLGAGTPLILFLHRRY